MTKPPGKLHDLLRIVGVGVVVSFSTLSSGEISVDESQAKFYSIEKGRARETLMLAAVHAQIEILYDLETVGELMTNAIEGVFAPDKALEAMLEGTACKVITVNHGRSYAVVLRNPEEDTSDLDFSAPSDDAVSAKGDISGKEEKKGFFHWVKSAFKVEASTVTRSKRSSGDSESIYELSPFEVNASQEDGYLATSSIAGSRINTPVSDVGSSISVYTDAILEDLAATDNETLLIYGMNTEVGGFRGNFINATSQGIENGNLIAANSNNRIRGLTSADNTTNYYLTDVPWDGYFVRRIDVQRGANSVLFGLGSPAGIINATPLDAEFDRFGRFQHRVDRYGSTRTSLDINSVLMANTAAVRIALLEDDRQFQQRPAFEERERGYISFTWTPGGNPDQQGSLRLKGRLEFGTITSNRPRMVAPVDKLTMWMAAPSESGIFGDFAGGEGYGLNEEAVDQFQDYSTATGEPNFNPWIAPFFDGITPLVQYDESEIIQIREKASNDRGSWYYDTQLLEAGVDAALPNDGSASSNGREIERTIRHPGQMSLNGLLRVAETLSLPHSGFWRDRSLLDTRYFDFFNQLIDGNMKREFQRWHTWELDLTQSFLNNQIGYNIGAFHQNYETEFLSSLGNVFVPSITVDVGLWDVVTQAGHRVPNPKQGSVMARDENAGGRESFHERDSFRFQLFLQHDFTRERDSFLSRILGRHDWVAVAQNRQLKQNGRSFDLLGMGRDYHLERAETIPNAETPGPGSRMAEYERNLGSIAPDLIFYLEGNSDYTAIQPIAASLNDLPFGMVSIRGFDATPLPGFTAEAAAILWNDSPWERDNQPDSLPIYQSSNPEQYVGWLDSIGDYYIANALKSEQDREYLTTTRTYFTEQVDTVSGVWKGRWLSGGLVGMFGWRRDRVTETWYEHDYRDDGPTFELSEARSERSTEVESRNWSIKANLSHLSGLSSRMPFDVHLLYAEGEVQTPDPTRVDVFGDTLPNSTGHTEDLTIMLTASDSRWSFRATKYKTLVKDAISTASIQQNKWRLQQVLQQGAFRAGLIETGSENYTAEWLPLSRSARDAGYEIEAAYRREVMAPAWRAFERELWERFPKTRNWYVSEFQPGDQTPPEIKFPDNATLIEDTLSRGWEFEFAGNIGNHWNLLCSVSNTEAIRDGLPGEEFDEVIRFISEAMLGSAGEIPIWWYTGPGVGSWLDPFLGEVRRARILNGTAQPEIRKWKANMVANYNFGGTKLDGLNIGAAWRYEDSQVYAYGLELDEAGRTELLLDETYRDDARNTIDLWVAYTHMLSSDVTWKIQLNVFNAFGENELVPLHRNPDGSYGLMGIHEGMSWALTNSFSF